MFDRFGTAVTGVRGASLVTLVTAVGLLAVGALVNNLWAAPRVPAAGRAVLAQCAGDCDGDGTVRERATVRTFDEATCGSDGCTITQVAGVR
ncbi:hypothetical protein L6Q96_20530 [Candidatus Binatia bacterium]|nr:hypothetical protein [Candidatus Binatia bacterium]